MIEKGISFPYMFDSSRKVTNKVSGVDKIKADLNIILRQCLYTVFMRPELGTDWDSILFVEDIAVTRDLLYSLVSDVVNRVFEKKVTLKNIKFSTDDTVLYIDLIFRYMETDIEFSTDYSIGG